MIAVYSLTFVCEELLNSSFCPGIIPALNILITFMSDNLILLTAHQSYWVVAHHTAVRMRVTAILTDVLQFRARVTAIPLRSTRAYVGNRLSPTELVYALFRKDNGRTQSHSCFPSSSHTAQNTSYCSNGLSGNVAQSARGRKAQYAKRRQGAMERRAGASLFCSSVPLRYSRASTVAK